MSLLDKARSYEGKSEPKDVDKELFEIAIAYCNNELSMSSIAKALGISSSAANGKVMNVIFNYVRNNPKCLNVKG